MGGGAQARGARAGQPDGCWPARPRASRTCAPRSAPRTPIAPKGELPRPTDGVGHQRQRPALQRRPVPLADRRVPERRARAPRGRRRGLRLGGGRPHAPGSPNGKPAVLIIVFRQPGANVIETVDRIKALHARCCRPRCPPVDQARGGPRPHHDDPRLRSATSSSRCSSPSASSCSSSSCSCATPGPRSSRAWPCRCPSWARSAVMYLLGYSLDNLSLMALTISTGFVVDDAIVVIENITRHLEAGSRRLPGRARRLARDRLHRALDEHVAGRGLHPHPRSWAASSGRLFREFAVTLSDRHRRLAGRVAHHHADDVRALPASLEGRASTGASYRLGERAFDALARGLRPRASAGCCAIRALTRRRHAR